MVPVIDSIRKLEGENISANIDRTNLFKVQTPQCFLASYKRAFYSQGYSRLFTDDSTVFESIEEKYHYNGRRRKSKNYNKKRY